MCIRDSLITGQFIINIRRHQMLCFLTSHCHHLHCNGRAQPPQGLLCPFSYIIQYYTRFFKRSLSLFYAPIICLNNPAYSVLWFSTNSIALEGCLHPCPVRRYGMSYPQRMPCLLYTSCTRGPSRQGPAESTGSGVPRQVSSPWTQEPNIRR